jgi:lysine 2,3-aminomutase
MEFRERVSGFLEGKLQELKEKYGPDSKDYIGLSRQYHRSKDEDFRENDEHNKHYEAAVDVCDDSHEIMSGLERLYARVLVIEPTLSCAANCRYCLRQNYDKYTLTEKQLVEIAKYCGSEENASTLEEVLITGGDPLLIPARLEFLLSALLEHAPNIKTIRIGTRLMTQDATRFDDKVFALFQDKPELNFEVGTQINHPSEFFPETEAIFKRLKELGVRIYAQNVLLRGVNDDIDTLTRLYMKVRDNGLEPHYLFHCCPIIGMQHMRTTVRRGVQLARELCSGGRISGRAKPMYALMTDIGKVVMWEDSIADEKDGYLLMKSGYHLEDRLRWNPSWKMPESAEVDENGYLRVWYKDGMD